jgi:hypothetical protein
MRIKSYGIPAVTIALVLGATLIVWADSSESEVRSTAQRIFGQLRAGHYSELYDALPESSRARVKRESFVRALQRSEGVYKLERLEVGPVHVSGDLAVAETTMYGTLLRPIQSEGKIVSQQYMVKERGSWKVATGDQTVVDRFLRENPEFAKRFPARSPHVYMKKDGKWVDVSAALYGRRGR